MTRPTLRHSEEGHIFLDCFTQNGHVLGIGILWVLNGLYIPDSGVYNSGVHIDKKWKATGCSGPLPVELDGGTGMKNAHWDERLVS